MKKFLLLLNVLFVFPILAQNRISGYVFDDENQKPLENANVFIPELNIGTASNQKGFFEINSKIDLNDKHLIVSYLGFKKFKIKLKNKIYFEVFLKKEILSSQSILVKAITGQKGITPISFSKIKRAEIEKSQTYQDVPEYLSYLPNTTFYSEGGAGLGYNYLSIRGFDQRRISVSVNGIPQNDPEDHNVYWLDMPDLLGSTGLIQVQRGSGSGISGYPAIGGAINIITSPFSDKKRIQFSSSIGAFNTRKYTATFSSGLINNKYSIYARVGQILSTGYRQKNWINFKSFHISAVRYDENLTTQINIFGGPVADALIYNGIAKFAIKDKEARKANYSYWEADSKKYNYVVERRDDEIENFSQPHFELLNEFRFSENIKFNSALFLVLGNGFFDYDGSWSVYYDDYFRLKKNKLIQNSNQEPTNTLIRAMVENKQIGWIPRLSVEHKNGNLLVGGQIRFHNSVHWGSINYGEKLPVGLTKTYKFYYYEGGKDILNFFVSENYNLTDQVSFVAEIQGAYHNYKIKNEKYENNNFSINDFYLNPRLGINYKINKKANIYFATARVTREPRLKNYYDAAESSAGKKPQFETDVNGNYIWSKPLVKPETMTSFEIGAMYSSKNYELNLNAYFMNFENEIVKNGQVDRWGQPVTGNIPKTIHTGMEFSATVNVTKRVTLIANASYSKNYISSGSTFYKKQTLKEIDLSGNKIAGFPDVTLNAILRYEYHGFNTTVFFKYVGDFYSDNYDSRLKTLNTKYYGLTDYSDNKVDAYFVTNLLINYEFGVNPIFEKIKLFVQINNLFNNLYASYAVGKEFYPAAERYLLTGIKLSL